jgi:tetratricopeptide (TPR) repeat protein
MNTQLVTRLQALAESASTENERLMFRAQWACAIARLGQIKLARSETANLRVLNASYEPRLTAWIFLAEGTADHFESLSTGAVDRFKRAHSLAIAIGDAEIRSLAAAWMGASEFLMAQYESACLHASEAIQHAPQTGTHALTRAHLVLANCLNAVGQSALASNHYGKARRYAVEAGDISMQSAILYNVAAFHISRISVDDAFKEPVGTELAIAELELNSIANLDIGLELDSLKAMVPLLRAQMLVIRRLWSEAEAIYASQIVEAATHGQLRIAPRYLAEQAQCLAEMGMQKEAIDLALKAQSALTERTEMDDRAACYARVALCFTAIGMNAEATAHLAKASVCRLAFAQFQDAHRARITSIAQGH